MHSPITITFDRSSLLLTHQSRCRTGECSEKYGDEAARWRAAAMQMLTRIGANKSEWRFKWAETSVDGRKKSVQFSYERISELQTGASFA